MAGSNEDLGWSRRPDAEDRRWSSTGQGLSGWTIKRSGDAMYGLHRTQGDEECRFLGLASNPMKTLSPSLTSKPVTSCFPI
jgi:hypothetical protein